MSQSVVTHPALNDCWNRIGIRGDRSCAELSRVVHCHNCPVFAAAGRRFLDGPSPEDYLAEWTDRLIEPLEAPATDLESLLVFRVGEEWLALPVRVLVEVTTPRRAHRIPRREGILAGLVNIRGELHLCVRLAQLLGIPVTGTRAAFTPGWDTATTRAPRSARLLVVQRDGERWVFPVDEVDQVYRLSLAELTPAPATLARALARLTRGILVWRERAVGCLDDARLFETLRTRVP